MIRAISYCARAAAVFLLASAVGACGHMPWSGHTAESPRVVSVLQELAEDGTVVHPFPQYWKRNTLLVDMQGAAPSGKVVLKPREDRKWPVRVAFRARPGTLGLIEVIADQRMLIPISTEGTEPVDVELLPGVYTAKTEQITVQWGNR